MRVLRSVQTNAERGRVEQDEQGVRFVDAAADVFTVLRLDIGDEAAAEQLLRDGWSNGWMYLDQGDVPAEPEPEPALTAAADVQTGAMVAFIPAAEDGHRLALTDDGTEPADQLHVTSTYLGKAADWDEEARQELVSRLSTLVDGWEPVSAQVFGLAVLNPQGEEPCLVANVGGQDLADRQAELVEAVGGGAPDQHAPWLAHITLAYHPDPRMLLTDDTLQRCGPVMLDRVRIAFAGEYTDLVLDGQPLVARAYTRDSHGQFSSTGGGAAAGGGVRGSFASAQSNEELAGAFQDEFRRTTGRDIHVDFGGLDTERAAGHAEGIMRGVERYPDNGLTEVGTFSRQRPAPGMSRLEQRLSDDAYAVTTHDGHGIYLNEGMSRRDLDLALQRDSERHALTAPSYVGIGAHEMGHVVTINNEAALVQGYAAMLGKNTRRHETPTNFVKRTMGTYATQSEHEMAGEALADVLTNGSKASTTSKAIVDAMDANIPGAKT